MRTDRARSAGAVKVSTLAVKGLPVDVLDQAVADSGADLLVVGNVGLNTLTGRILGHLGIRSCGPDGAGDVSVADLGDGPLVVGDE